MNTLDFTRIANLPPPDRRELALSAMKAELVTPAQALALMRGEVPFGSSAEAAGANGYAGAPSRSVTETKKQSRAIYGAAMMRDLSRSKEHEEAARRALPRIDELIQEVANAGGQDAPRAIRKLNAFISELGVDVVNAIAVGPGVENQGIGYINSRVQAAGSDTKFEPIMDAWSAYAVKLNRAGDLRGSTASIKFSFSPYNEKHIEFRRSQGDHETGSWGVHFEGVEAFDFKASRDGSVSAKLRQLTRGVTGSLGEIIPILIELLGEQALPQGYTFEIDLDRVPKEQQAAVRAQLDGLAELGAELKYRVEDADKLMSLAQEGGEIGARINELLRTDPEKWTVEQQAEYAQLHGAYHDLPRKRFEP